MATPPVEIVVVDDGATDGTAELVEDLGLANVRVIRQANAGKVAALNTGIAVARHDIVVLIDGDTVFEPGTVAALVGPFADRGVGAVSGNARVANRSGVLARPIGLRHGRGQRRATIAVDLAVDRDYRNRIPAPALHDDVDRPAGFHRNG